MKYLLFVLLLVLIIFVETKYKLPHIKLPKAMQHNNLGELPIVEIADDNGFYEKDGEEEKSRAMLEKSYNLLAITHHKQCVDLIEIKCGVRIPCYQKEMKKCNSRYEKELKKYFINVYPFTSFFIFKNPPDMKCDGFVCEGSWPAGYRGDTLK